MRTSPRVTSPDAKIAILFETPNVPLPAMPIFVLYAPGPGQPYQYKELKPEELMKALLAANLNEFRPRSRPQTI